MSLQLVELEAREDSSAQADAAVWLCFAVCLPLQLQSSNAGHWRDLAQVCVTPPLLFLTMLLFSFVRADAERRKGRRDEVLFSGSGRTISIF